MRVSRNWLGAVAVVGLIGSAGSYSASAQSFILSQNGKTVGSANLAMKPAGGGFTATSGAKVTMPGLNYSFSENESLDGAYQVKSVQLKGSVNGTSASVTGAPQSSQSGSQSGPQFGLKIDANGKVINTPLQAHPQSVFYPDFDPAALQVLLNLGAAHNNRDIWAIVPKQSGSIDALQIATKPDEEGTLDGKPVVVHHLTVKSPSETTEVFSGPSNQLVQAEWSDEGFALVRQGFVMKPPAKPRSAPPAPQPGAPGNGAGGQAGSPQTGSPQGQAPPSQQPQ